MENKNNKQSLTSDTSNDRLSNENYENISNVSDENVNTETSSNTNNQEGEDIVKAMPRAFSSSALRIKEKFSFWERMHTGYNDTDAGCSTNSPVR